MKALFLTVLLAVSAMAQAVRVTGPAYDPSGAVFTNGTISVTGGVVKETIDLTDGTFGITLPVIPTTANTSYRVIYRTRTGTTWTRFWVPRASSTAVEVSAIESTAPPAGEISPTQIGGALGNNTRVLCSNGSVTVWCDASSGGGTSLPSQSGNNGRFLTTNGSTPSWAVINSAVWGNITGALADQTDVTNALNSKEPTIAAGTTGQYLRGDKSWVAFPTIPTAAPQLCEVKNAAQGGSGASGFSIPTQANQPIATVIAGTNVSTGATRFIAPSTTVQFSCALDPAYNASGSATLFITWRSVTTTGTVTWTASNAAVAAGDSLDPVLANSNNVAASVQGNTLRANTASLVLTNTGWAANETVFVQVSPTASTTAIDATNFVEILSVRLSIPRT